MKKTKYGILEYHTENIGDEIQSIAANRFIPKIDYYFDRDNINATKIPSNEEIKLIMNGWYTHYPQNWPPKNPSLTPLLISMHIEQDAPNLPSAEAFSTQESKIFLKKHAPVGARNLPTKAFLDSIGIESFFSGCITLTLIADPNVKKQKYILAVDAPKEVLTNMKKRTSRPIIHLSTNRKRNLDRDTRFAIAALWLYFYQSAHAVVTTRLHTMLPCLALGTPVFGISGQNPKRYEGLIELVRHSSAQDFINHPSLFDLEHPPKNPNLYKKIRSDLEKKCSNFTNYDSKQSYLKKQSIVDLLNDPNILQFFFNATNDTLLYEEILNNPSQPQIPGIKESIKNLKDAIKRRVV